MKTLKINVTETDLLSVIPNNCRRCPVALAVNRELEKINKNFYCLVGQRQISFHHMEEIETVFNGLIQPIVFDFFPLSIFLSNLISLIDMGEKVEPFSFDLDLVSIKD